MDEERSVRTSDRCQLTRYTFSIETLEYHRRLMLIASCALTAAAWGRLPESVLPGFWFYAGVDLLIVIGAARDLFVNRKIHRVYLIVLPLFVAGQIAISQISYTKCVYALRKEHLVLNCKCRNDSTSPTSVQPRPNPIGVLPPNRKEP
jgi:hypothetical protein